MSRFDDDIAVIPKGDWLYGGNVSDNWSINGIPNGGYLMALLTNAMLQKSRNDNIVVVTAAYLSRLRPGPVDLAVENFATSLNMDRFETRLIQDGKERVRAMGTFCQSSQERNDDRYEKDPPIVAPLEQCIRAPHIPKYTLMDNLDICLDPECTGWFVGKLSPKSEMKGWIKFKEDRSFDPLSVLLMADAFPPPILASQGAVAWVPTVELSINMHRVPQTTWLKCRFRTHFMSRGFLQEDGEVWDENGELVAVSRQVAQFKRSQ